MTKHSFRWFARSFNSDHTIARIGTSVPSRDSYTLRQARPTARTGRAHRHSKTGDFQPAKFEDQYESAVRELLKRKLEGKKIEVSKERAPAKVINLMDALRRSVEAERAAEGRKAPADSVQHRVEKKKPARSSARHKRAG